jgi:hypothetical protein
VGAGGCTATAHMKSVLQGGLSRRLVTGLKSCGRSGATMDANRPWCAPAPSEAANRPPAAPAAPPSPAGATEGGDGGAAAPNAARGGAANAGSAGGSSGLGCDARRMVGSSDCRPGARGAAGGGEQPCCAGPIARGRGSARLVFGEPPHPTPPQPNPTHPTPPHPTPPHPTPPQPRPPPHPAPDLEVHVLAGHLGAQHRAVVKLRARHNVDGEARHCGRRKQRKALRVGRAGR